MFMTETPRDAPLDGTTVPAPDAADAQDLEALDAARQLLDSIGSTPTIDAEPPDDPARR